MRDGSGILFCPLRLLQAETSQKRYSGEPDGGELRAAAKRAVSRRHALALYPDLKQFAPVFPSYKERLGFGIVGDSVEDFGFAVSDLGAQT